MTVACSPSRAARSPASPSSPPAAPSGKIERHRRPAARPRTTSDGTVAQASVTSAKAGSSASTVWSNHDYAKRVWFLTPQGLRPGWSTYVQTAAAPTSTSSTPSPVEALYRHSNSDNATGDALVYDNYPGAPKGGKARGRQPGQEGWLSKKSARYLKGTSVIAWADLNDDNASTPARRPRCRAPRRGQFKLKPFDSRSSLVLGAASCARGTPNTPFSWKKNLKADATHAFYLASNFHDYLAKAPISFTTAAGNFAANGGDPVLLNALDGADTDRPVCPTATTSTTPT